MQEYFPNLQPGQRIVVQIGNDIPEHAIYYTWGAAVVRVAGYDDVVLVEAEDEESLLRDFPRGAILVLEATNIWEDLHAGSSDCQYAGDDPPDLDGYPDDHDHNEPDLRRVYRLVKEDE